MLAHTGCELLLLLLICPDMVAIEASQIWCCPFLARLWEVPRVYGDCWVAVLQNPVSSMRVASPYSPSGIGETGILRTLLV